MSYFSDILERALQEEAVLLSPDLKVHAANRYFYLANNLEAGDIENRPCHEVLKSCSVFCRQAMGECPMHEALATGAKVSVTLEDVQTANGVRHFIVDVYPVASTQEENPLLLHITRDITARVNEERLKEEMWREILLRMEQLYGAMVQSHQQIEGMGREFDQLTDLLPLAMIWWDSEGMIVRVNPSAEVLLGWNQGELAGRHLSTIFASGAAQSRCRQAIGATLLGQTMGYSLTENRTAGGSLITCEWFHTPIQAENGVITGGLSLGQDVSARFVAENRQKTAEQKNSALLRASFDAVVMINSLGRIVEWNQAAESLFGWRPKEILGREAESLFPSEQRNSQREMLREFITARPQKMDAGRQVLQQNAMRRDGTVFPASLLLIRTLIDESSGAVVVFHDLSEQLHIKTLLERSEKLKEIGLLADGLAHRFNNSLATLQGAIDLLRSRSQDKGLQPQLTRLEQQVEQDRQAVGSLLCHTGLPAAECGQQDVHKLLDEVIRLSSFRWRDLTEREGGRIEVEKAYAPELPLLAINAADFREMILALLFNAIDSVAGGGHVTIFTSQHNGQVHISVEDNGEGIDREHLDHIFQPFYTTKGGNHAGMGLTLARNIARQYGGELTVTSTGGLGARFTVKLPLQPATAVAPKRLAAVASRHILLVGSDDGFRLLLEEALADKDQQLTVSNDGRQALLLAADSDFELFICDEECGGMGGRELIWRLKHRTPETPALFLTASTDSESRLKAMAEGADLILTKPFTAQQLLTSIDRLLQS